MRVNFDELSGQVVQAITQAGGSIEYAALYEQTPYPGKQSLPVVLRSLKDQGKLTQSVGFDFGANRAVHTITLVQGNGGA